MKIIVAGAGIGGLFAAGLLSEKHDVTIYEKCEGEDVMRYDWHDDVSEAILSSFNIPLPAGSHKRRDWTFYTPIGGHKVSCKQHGEKREYSIERRPLNRLLIERIGKARLVFNAEVTNAVVENGKVIGCVVKQNGVECEEKCDLVIDAAGVNSPVRLSVPEAFNLDAVSDDEKFFVVRSFFKLVGDAPTEDTDKVYLKHMERRGISWCITDEKKGLVDVLIGSTGKLTQHCIDEAMANLRKRNDYLGTELVKGGGRVIIPVRRPLSKFIGNGYAAVGDSACMTVPLIGSGIGLSLKAANALAEVINEYNDVSEGTLWKYQVKCYEMFGANNAGVDYMRRWLLDTPCEDLTFLMKSGVITDDDMRGASLGQAIQMKISSLPKRLAAGITRLDLLAKAAAMPAAVKKAVAIASAIPNEYEIEKIEKWRKKLNGLFK